MLFLNKIRYLQLYCQSYFNLLENKTVFLKLYRFIIYNKIENIGLNEK